MWAALKGEGWTRLINALAKEEATKHHTTTPPPLTDNACSACLYLSARARGGCNWMHCVFRRKQCKKCCFVCVCSPSHRPSPPRHFHNSILLLIIMLALPFHHTLSTTHSTTEPTIDLALLALPCLLSRCVCRTFFGSCCLPVGPRPFIQTSCTTKARITHIK